MTPAVNGRRAVSFYDCEEDSKQRAISGLSVGSISRSFEVQIRDLARDGPFSHGEVGMDGSGGCGGFASRERGLL